jgi:hypothetical protein
MSDRKDPVHEDRARAEGRIRGYRVSLEVFVAWMKDGRIPEHLLVSDTLPGDATLLGFREDPTTETLVLFISSLEFERSHARDSSMFPVAEDPEWAIVEQ